MVTGLKPDRGIVIAALLLVICTGWIYVLSGAGMSMSAFEMSSWSRALGRAEPGQMDMPECEGMSATSSTEGSASDDMSGSPSAAMAGAMAAKATPAAWTVGYAILLFFMWWIMMIAMMLPSATPMILLYDVVDRRTKERAGQPGGPWAAGAFALGYLLAWAAFSINAFFSGGILLFVGVYQLTPIKRACLKHCRGPLEFLCFHWRPGIGGALRMGIHHGAFCLGCCWGLMAILFFGGIMNLYWIVGLAAIVLIEKVFSVGPKFSVITGIFFTVWGMSFVYDALA
jgi:predicted metal-binding membrane protein